ncbi:nuclear transport factor 2 family protein [Amycolatopsis sp. A133]|uniref:nuclear transport factor 2 family protein n=1 Tax=Amycolatopsis sp. A133 TaxID=3064472 RepID=UPI002800056D|nr:nuclear transport factor 2 family protein [Amycolatopsis sp. A133]MDQ7809090.1 nuclear transport factor 2 family protein [Amycolatopsis sp. A133]
MSHDNRAIVRAAWQAFASHDADQISAVFTEDAEWLAPPENATAIALDGPSHLIGSKAITRFLAEDFSRLFVRDVAVTFHGLHADGEQVIVEETMTATLANGNHYTNDYCFVFELRDSLIHRVREYMDTARGHRMIFGEATPVIPGPEKSAAPADSPITGKPQP